MPSVLMYISSQVELLKNSTFALPSASVTDTLCPGFTLVVLRPERGGLVEALEVGATNALVALGRVFRVEIDVDAGMTVHHLWMVGHDIDRFHVGQEKFGYFCS